VLLLGHRMDVPALLARAQVAVLPSHAEGLSNALIEAMAASLPVVATAVGGNVELVAEDVSGHLVPPHKTELLAERLAGATRWALDQAATRGLGAGFFGSSTGAAAALVAAAELGPAMGAVVSRGGRPDLAGVALERVTAPTLLIVGGDDTPVIPLNEAAYGRLQCEKALRIIPGASHLFEEPGALEKVAKLASEWFADHLQASAPHP